MFASATASPIRRADRLTAEPGSLRQFLLGEAAGDPMVPQQLPFRLHPSARTQLRSTVIVPVER